MGELEGAPPESIDQLINAFIDSDSLEGELALLRTGESGFGRLLDIVNGAADPPFRYETIGGHEDQRRHLERLMAAVHLLATAYPSMFLQWLAENPSKAFVPFVPILGDIDDARATELLVERAADPHYIVRFNVIEALARSSDPHARAALETALGDAELVVRVAAIRGIGRGEPKRAIKLCRDELAAEPSPRGVVRTRILDLIQELEARSD